MIVPLTYPLLYKWLFHSHIHYCTNDCSTHISTIVQMIVPLSYPLLLKWLFHSHIHYCTNDCFTHISIIVHMIAPLTYPLVYHPAYCFPLIKPLLYTFVPSYVASRVYTSLLLTWATIVQIIFPLTKPLLHIFTSLHIKWQLIHVYLFLYTWFSSRYLYFWFVHTFPTPIPTSYLPYTLVIIFAMIAFK